MRYRCSNCTEVFVVNESSSLYPQSFCSKGCEVESVVMNQRDEDLMNVLASLESQQETPIALVH